MFDPKNIKVGMLVRNLEGERLGRVVQREEGCFHIQQPGDLRAARFVVEDADVMTIQGAEVVLREGPATVVPEPEFEARRAAGVTRRRNAEGWRSAGLPRTIRDEALQVSMPVVDVEGKKVGQITALGEGFFDLRCATKDELATVRLGDVLNVVEGRVIIRMGADVLKNRRHDRETDHAPVI